MVHRLGGLSFSTAVSRIFLHKILAMFRTPVEIFLLIPCHPRHHPGVCAVPPGPSSIRSYELKGFASPYWKAHLSQPRTFFFLFCQTLCCTWHHIYALIAYRPISIPPPKQKPGSLNGWIEPRQKSILPEKPTQDERKIHCLEMYFPIEHEECPMSC